MAKTKYFVPDKEKPHFNKEKGWIEKIDFLIRPFFISEDSNASPDFVLDIFTFREFTYFRYLIDYELKRKGRDIQITLKGLNTDNQTFPDTGKANARIIFKDLIGSYNFIIKRSSGEENLFQFYIDPIQQKIILKKELPDKKSNRKFVELLG